MSFRERKSREWLSPNAKMENGGGNKENEILNEVLTAYDTYLHAWSLQKFLENKVEKDNCSEKENLLAHCEALRSQRLELKYLRETGIMLAKFKGNLDSRLKLYLADISENLPKIRNELKDNHLLPVKSAIVDPDCEQLMKILPLVKQILEKFQDTIDHRNEIHAQVGEMCSLLVKSISRAMEMHKRYNNLVDEMKSLGLSVSARTS